MNADNQKSLLVVAAHPGDFVWRCAGAIALHAAANWRVKIVCASCGAKGEAGSLWKQPGATLDKVVESRRREAENAAQVLGAAVNILDLDDYPLVLQAQDILGLSRIMREFRPTVVITHPLNDPGNVDHVNTANAVLQARSLAAAPGYGPDTIASPNVLFFEPHQPEQSNFKADLFLNITDVWDTKKRAFEAIESQRGLWDYYERVALQRGAQAGRRSSAPIRYAEAFQTAFPNVVDLFS